MSAVPALWTKHRPLARSIAREFHIPGSDRDDVIQESMIGLWIAARTHDRSQSAFPTWARIVIRRHLTDCLRVASSGRAGALTDSERNHVPQRQLSLDDEVEQRAAVRALTAAIMRLPARQRDAVVGVCFEGRPYAALGSPKAIDNLLFSARRTLMVALHPVC